SVLAKALYQLSAETLDRLPAGLVAGAYAAVRGRGPKFAAIEDKLRKFVRMSRARDAFGAYEAAISEWSASEVHRLTGREPAGVGVARAAFQSVTGTEPRDQFMHYDMTRYLPGDLLVKVDRASMFVSLEAREPFLDHEAARLAAALPMSWKIRDGRNKYVLRRLLARYFPQELFERPKQGFSAPVGEWLRGPLRAPFLEALSPARIRAAGLLDEHVVGAAVGNFLSATGQRGSPAGAWILFQLQQWAQRWLREPKPQPMQARAVGL